MAGELQIAVSVTKNGNPTVADALVLEDEAAAYGSKRTPEATIFTAAGTALTAIARGEYSDSLTDVTPPTVGYDYTLKLTVGSTPFYFPFSNKAKSTAHTHRVSIPDTTYFTSEAEVMRMLGPFGVDLSMDDYDAHSRGQVWVDMLEDVDTTMQMYVNQFYDPSGLKSNSWMRRRATILTAFSITNRRGNPTLFNNRADRVYEELNGVRDGRFHIPSAAPLGNRGPIVRNYTMQNFNRVLPMRVESLKSTGDNYPSERTAITPYLW